MSVTIFWCEWDGETDSHELLRQAVGKYLHKDFQTLQVVRKENEKPALRDFPQINFSISHSENIWSCAVGDCKVGLDLQRRYEKDGERLARRFFHPEEISWMEINGFGEFSRIWTYKESYVKYTGVGLRRGLDYFSVIPGLQAGENKGGPAGEVYQQEIPFLESFYLVLTSREQQNVRLEKMEQENKERKGMA